MSYVCRPRYSTGCRCELLGFELEFLIIPIKIGEVVSTIPSEYLVIRLVKVADVSGGFEAIGFNVETVEVCVNVLISRCYFLTFDQYKNIKFQVWDLGGQSSIR